MRATSTVLDTTVFLLLVSAAIGTLVAQPTTPTAHGSNPAAGHLRVLTTTTATVEYPVTPRAGGSNDSGGEPVVVRRTSHGTAGALLAAAAVAGLAVDGERVLPLSRSFQAAVVTAVSDRTAQSATRVSVTATWDPVGSAAVGGRVGVGSPPPRDVAVDATTASVPSGVQPPGGKTTRAASERGYGGLARVVAAALVEGLFPPRPTRLALRVGGRDAAVVRARYASAARTLGVDLSGGSIDPARANERLAAALATRVRTALSSTYPTPAAAARGIDLSTVRITVRAWSA